LPKSSLTNDGAYSFDVSLIVESEKESIYDAIKILGFTEYKIIEKGKLISRALPCSEVNSYIYTQTCDEPEMYQKALLTFLEIIKEKKDDINFLKTKYNIYLKVFCQSDYAQMQFELLPEAFKAMYEIGLKCEFSILSWGEVCQGDGSVDTLP